MGYTTTIMNEGVKIGLLGYLPKGSWKSLSYKGLTGLLAPFFLCVGLSVSSEGQALAQVSLNLDAIRHIESSGRNRVVNPRTKATGAYQITPIALRDFNREIGMVRNDGGELTLNDMKDPFYAGIVAEWYALRRIPRLIKNSRLPNSLLVHIACWNWGVRNTRAWYAKGGKFRELPKETRDFYEKYKRIQSKGNSGQLRPVKRGKG